MVDGSYRLRTLDLFSGIGGISLALGPWCRTVCYCEIDPSAVGVLTKEMGRGNLDVAPVWDDIRTFGRTEIEQVGPIECVTGGFPCQDISCAGKGAGITGERSGLFFQQMRIIRLARPRIIFLENVRGITKRALAVVIGELADCGYDAKWRVLSAEEVGAPHKRDRWWCVAYPFGSVCGTGTERTGRQAGTDTDRGCAGTDLAHRDGDGRSGILRQAGQGQEGTELGTDTNREGVGDGGVGPARETNLANANIERWGETGEHRCDAGGERAAGGGQKVANANRQRLQGQRANKNQEGREGQDKRSSGLCCGRDQWDVEPDVGRVADGVPFRVDRLRGLGNAVVPACARKAFELLIDG